MQLPPWVTLENILMVVVLAAAGLFHYNFILSKLASAQEEAVKVLESMPEPKVED